MNKWTPEDLATLRRTYPQGIPVAMAALPGRTKKQIQTAAGRRGWKVSPEARRAMGKKARAIQLSGGVKHWSDEDVATLCLVYPRGVTVAMAALSHKSRLAIRGKANAIGLRVDDQVVRELARNGQREMRLRRRARGITLEQRMACWSSAERLALFGRWINAT